MDPDQGPFPRPFGKYRLLKPLARGGMGELYLAALGERGVEKVCVIKTVLPHIADSEFLSRFRDEAKVVVKLAHGNIVPVFDAGQQDGRFYLAMEHVDGKDLRAIWNRCAERKVGFPVDVSIHIIREICRGLDYAHRYGGLRLVHRDVSPPNVLVSYAGEVRLADFGLATSSLKVTETAPGIVYGKLAYMSPEQARGEPLDGRADVCAAGILLWEMLTGRRFFSVPQDRPQELIVAVRDPKFKPPSEFLPGLAPELDGIVRRALEPNRAARFQTAEQLRAALAEYLAKVAPATDSSRLAAFLRHLFGDEIDHERAERETLLAREFDDDAPTPVAEPSRRTEDMTPVYTTGELPPPEDGSGLIGTVLDGRYELVRLVGEGGMGRVYEARHREIDKRVAVKVLHPVYSHLPELASRFRREARAASKIGHPGIVDVTDSGTTPQGSLYFVMEYLEGIDLADVLAQQGRLPIDRSVHIATQVCRALGAAHEAGIVHRDMKPENIFLIARDGNSDFVKIVDFGIARNAEIEEIEHVRTSRLTRPGMAMGTPEYMSPEQAAGKPADARVDIYALGAILYEMLAGQPPHAGENVMEVLNRKATESAVPLHDLRPDVPPELEEVVRQALAYNADDRQQTMAQIEYQLNRCMRGRGAAVASLLGIGENRSMPSDQFGAVATAVNIPVPVRGRRTRIAVGAGAIVGAVLAIVLLRGGREPATAPGAKPADRSAAAAAASTTAASTPVAPTPVAETSASAPAVPAAPAKTEKASAPASRGDGDGAARKRGRARRLVAEGREHLGGGRLGAARDSFRAALDTGLERGAALSGLATVAWQQQKFAEAAGLAARAVAAGGGNSARMVLANAYFKQGKYARAAAEYEKILARDPGNREAMHNRDAAKKKLGP